MSKLDLTPSCLSSRAFYRTRRALVALLNVPSRSISPSSDLEPLFPESQRREKWSEAARLIELEFPDLRYPSRWLQRFWKLAAGVAAVVVLACSIIIQHHFGEMISSFLIWISAVALWMIFFAAILSIVQRYATTLQTELPCQTAGDLSRLVLTMNYQAFSPSATQNAAPSKEDVWIKLVEVISDQLQIAREEVVPSASFSEDLGAD